MKGAILMEKKISFYRMLSKESLTRERERERERESEYDFLKKNPLK
jgi:hypothetical protein